MLPFIAVTTVAVATQSQPIPEHSLSGFSAGASMALNHLVNQEYMVDENNIAD